jgi:hypothetical protein
VVRQINATDRVENRMAKGKSRTPSISAPELSGDEESEEENMDWRKCAMKLEEENDSYKDNYWPRMSKWRRCRQRWRVSGWT